MARRRHRRARRGKQDGLSKFYGPAAFGLSFLAQITSKDTNPNTARGQVFQAADWGTKGKILANGVLGRITGINIFNDAPQAPQTINPMGVFNAGAGFSLAALIYNKFAPKMGLPKLVPTSVAKNALKGFMLGGFFDDPARAGGGQTAFRGSGIGQSQKASQVQGFGGSYIG